MPSEMILEIALGLYVAVALLVLGIGIGDQASFTNPRYGLVLAVAIGWPFALLWALLVNAHE